MANGNCSNCGWEKKKADLWQELIPIIILPISMKFIDYGRKFFFSGLKGFSFLSCRFLICKDEEKKEFNFCAFKDDGKWHLQRKRKKERDFFLAGLVKNAKWWMMKMKSIEEKRATKNRANFYLHHFGLFYWAWFLWTFASRSVKK